MKKLSISRSMKTLSTLLHSEILCPALARLMTFLRPATLCLMITLIFSANFSIQAIANDSIQAIASDSIQAIASDSIQAITSDSIQAIASDSIQAIASDSIQAITSDSIDSIHAIISGKEMSGNEKSGIETSGNELSDNKMSDNEMSNNGSAEAAQSNKSEHPSEAVADKAEAGLPSEAVADEAKAELPSKEAAEAADEAAAETEAPEAEAADEAAETEASEAEAAETEAPEASEEAPEASKAEASEEEAEAEEAESEEAEAEAEEAESAAKSVNSKAESGTSSEGQEVSGKIYFQRNHIDIVPGYMGNDEQFASILERLDSVHPDDILGVKVVGSASPEGPLEFNTYLAIHRAAAIKDYLIKNHSGIFTDSLKWDVTYEYEDWSYVEELLENSDIAHREEALEIIRNTSYDPTGKTPSDRKEKLQQLYGRTVWYEMDRKLHPYSRGAELIVTLRDQAEMLEAKSVSQIAESENIEEEKIVFDTKVPTVEITPQRKPMLAVKTNLLLYGLYLPKYGFAPAPNIAVEFMPRQSHWTVGASLDIPWYRNYSNHKFFQIRNWQLEGRRYFKEAGQYWGWYAQAYVHTGVFGIGFNKEEGWEGESGGLGLGGGYVMPISKNKHWKLEFNLQFGYMRSQYDPYVYGHPTDGAEDGLYYYNWTLNPDLFEPRRYKHNWFGPTRVGITISYDLLHYKNKRK